MNIDNESRIDCIAIICLFAIVCEVSVVSQTEAEANSAKTMKASPTPRVTLDLQVTYKVGIYLTLLVG